MSDLSTTYLGLRLASPLIASAGPLTRKLSMLRQLEDAGVAAVVLPSLFEEEVVADEQALHLTLEQGGDSHPEASGYLPGALLGPGGVERHIELVQAAKLALSVPVIASLNAVRPGEWIRYAAELAEAGADALELNCYALETDPLCSAAEVEARHLDVIRQVRAAVQLPLAVKLSPFFTSLPHFAAAVVQAGADGLVLFNRFYQPDLDVPSMSVQPRIDLSDGRDLRLPLRWLGILRPQLPGTSLAASSGVYGATELIKTLLVGADVGAMTSALLRHGPQHASGVLGALDRWLEEHEHGSVAELIGSMSAASAVDAAAFERSHYVSVLQGYDPLLRW